MSHPVTDARRRAAWLLFAFAAFVLLAGLGLRDPWPADEPRFALVAKQMVDSGEYLIPHRGIELYSDKPPTFMWLQAAGFHLTGSWRIAFLLPSLLASLATLWLVFDLARRLWSQRAAWWATAMLLITVHFTYQAKKAQIDPAVVFWITLSGYGLLRHLLLGPALRWYGLAWFAAGIGVITKGVGFLALLMLLPYAWARWRGWNRLPDPGPGGWRWWIGPLLFVAAVAIWLVPMAWRAYGSGDPALVAYADDILFRQTAKRYANPWHHQQPWWYFLPIIALMWLPLSLALPWALPAWWRRLRDRADARFLLPLAFAAMVVLFFSISPGKRDVYILPALPMLALAAAPLLAAIARRRAFRFAATVAAVLLAGTLLFGGLVALLGEPGFETRLETQRGLDPAADDHWWMLVVIGALGVSALFWRHRHRGLRALAATLAAVWILAFGFWGYPMLNDANSARAVMLRARELAGAREIGLVAYKEQNLLHASEPRTEFGFLRSPAQQRRDGIAWMSARPQQRVLFVLEDAIGPCLARARGTLVGTANRRNWWLFDADALLPGCSEKLR